jgi:plasmid stabilization system protein ParE
MNFRVEFTETASREIAEQYEWLARHRSKFVADRFRDALLAAVRSLEKNPERCGKAPEAEWFGEGLRQLLHYQRRQVYRLLFEVQKGVVIILRIRHGRQETLQQSDM